VKDQLFIRTPTGMVPTPRAEQLALPLRHALAEMQRALEPETFVAAQANRRFSIAINNYAAIVMAAPLVAAVAAAAPLVQLDLRPSGTLDVFDLLDSGALDVAIGTFDTVGERFWERGVARGSFRRSDAPGTPGGRSKLSAEAFGALAHVAISSSGDDTGFIRTGRSPRGVTKRRIACAYVSLGRARSRQVGHGRHAEPAVAEALAREPPYSSVSCPSRHRWSVRRCCGTESSMATRPPLAFRDVIAFSQPRTLVSTPFALTRGGARSLDHRVDLFRNLELVEVAGADGQAVDDGRQPLRHQVRRVERGRGADVERRHLAARSSGDAVEAEDAFIAPAATCAGPDVITSTTRLTRALSDVGRKSAPR